MKQRIKKFGFYISIFVLACSTIMVSSCDSTSTEDPVVAPGTPTGLAASDGTAESLVTLEWTPPAEGGVSFYRLYRAQVIESTTGDYVLRKDFLYPTLNTDGTVASFDDNQLSKGKVYSYRVSAVNEGGESELSDAATGYADALAPDLPLPPSVGMKATNNQVHKVYLDWDAVPEATSYHIYRSDSPMGEYTEIGEVTDLDGVELVISTEPAVSEFYAFCDDSEDVAAWPDGSVEAQAFYYRVSSENSEGEGPMSDIVNGWFPYPVIDVAPDNMTATKGDFANKVVITWDSVATATSYVVYRSAKSGACETPGASSSYNQLAASSGTSYDDTSGTVDAEYCYTVRARNEAGESNAYSVPDYGNSSSTGLESPGNPTALTATDDGVNLITVSWTRADSIATHYLVYRSTEALTGYTLVATVADAAGDTWNDGNGSIDSVTVDTTFYYKVKAVVYEGGDTGNPIIAESSLTDHDTGFAYPTIPGSTTVTATDDAYWNRINVSWDALDRAETYTLYRKIGLGGTWERLQKDMTSTTYIDDSDDVEALWGEDVTYRVYGVNSNGDSEPEPTNSSESANYGDDVGTVELQAPSISSSRSGSWKINTTWGAIPCDDLAGRIEYAFYYKKSSAGSWSGPIYKDFHDYSGGYSHELTGLSAVTDYDIYVVPVYVSDGHEGPQSNTTTTQSW